MSIANKVRTGMIAAIIGMAGVVISAGQAAAQSASADDVQAADSCDIISHWGYKGKRMCGPGHVMDVDWDVNGSVDETFVIAPNREIWHTWANANGWKEMPGDGRADTFRYWVRVGEWRCVAVWAGSNSWDNEFDGGWSGWARGGC